MSKILLNKLQQALNSGELLDIVDKALSVTHVQRALGYSNKGEYIKIIREFLLNNDVDISHFTINGKPPSTILEKTCPSCLKVFKVLQNKDGNKQITCSRACSNTYFRSGENNGNFTNSPANYRRKAFSFYENKCIKCGYSNILALEVHHKDRNRNNNSLENLEILCANCHTIAHKSLER